MKILMDCSKIGKRVKKNSSMGFNTCHAALLLREDLKEHVKVAKEIGFRYIRFHNIFSDQVGLYQENESGDPIYDYGKFDQIFDAILEIGLLPFFEISFCPSSLKATDKTICFYEANTSVPNSFEKWKTLIKNVIEHVIERYGLECVKKWYFEVWNEPDLIFFDGSMEDYFDLYDHTVLAVKSVSPELRVGGPATSKCAWIKEFVTHIQKGSEITGFQPVPCDFIATHAYPSDVAFLNRDHGEVELQCSTIMTTLYEEVQKTVESSSLKGTPIFMGEWNSSAGPLALNHDEKNNGAFIIKTIVETRDYIEGSLFWNLSDIYEECQFHYTPFHGGYGILNVNGIPKSSYNAFKMLNRLNGYEVVIEGGAEDGIYAAYDPEKEELQILLHNYTEPGESGNEKEFLITLDHLKEKVYQYRSEAVTRETGSPYEWWQKIGAPDYLTWKSMQLLMEKSQMAIESKLIFCDAETSAAVLEEKLMAGDFKLIILKAL